MHTFDRVLAEDAHGIDFRLGRAAIGRQVGDLILQILRLQMGVALGRRHTGVAQQFLHRPQVGPGAQ